MKEVLQNIPEVANYSPLNDPIGHPTGQLLVGLTALVLSCFHATLLYIRGPISPCIQTRDFKSQGTSLKASPARLGIGIYENVKSTTYCRTSCNSTATAPLTEADLKAANDFLSDHGQIAYAKDKGVACDDLGYDHYDASIIQKLRNDPNVAVHGDVGGFYFITPP